MKNYDKYTINGRDYFVDQHVENGLTHMLKLWDFDFVSIDGVIENMKVNAQWTNQINVNIQKNQYYDIHYFFNTLINSFLPQLVRSDQSF